MANALHKSEGKLEAALEQMKDLPFPDQVVAKGAKDEGEGEEEEGKGKQKQANGEPPEEFLCPITQELMRDPVVASDGHTYEKYVRAVRQPRVRVAARADCVVRACVDCRSAIEEWIQKKAISPMTNGPLEGKLYPNFSLKSRISEWKEQHGHA